MYSQPSLGAFHNIALALSQTYRLETLQLDPEGKLVIGNIPPLFLRVPRDAEEGSGPADGEQYSAAVSRTHRVEVHFKIAEDPEEEKWVEEHGDGLYEVEIYGEILLHAMTFARLDLTIQQYLPQSCRSLRLPTESVSERMCIRRDPVRLLR